MNKPSLAMMTALVGLLGGVDFSDSMPIRPNERRHEITRGTVRSRRGSRSNGREREFITNTGPVVGAMGTDGVTRQMRRESSRRRTR